jgi:hypothetical protein
MERRVGGIDTHEQMPEDDPKGGAGASRIEACDRIKFFVHPNGSVVLLPKLPVSALRGIVKPPDRAVSIEQMAEAVISAAVEAEECDRRG